MSKVVTYVAGAAQVAFGAATGNPALIASGVSTIGGGLANEQRQQAAQDAINEQRRANAINSAQQAIARQRSVRMAVAESRRNRAIIESRAFAGGPAGAGQSITGDTASAIGASNTQAAAAFGIARARDRASQFNLESRSTNIFDAVSGAASVFGQGWTAYKEGKFEGIFGGSDNG